MSLINEGMLEFGGDGYNRRPSFRKSLAWAANTVIEALSRNTETGKAQHAHSQAENELLIEQFRAELQSVGLIGIMLNANEDPKTYHL